MDLGAVGVGAGVASVAWAVAWGIYVRKTEPRQALRTAREVRRGVREEEGLRVVHAQSLAVIQMCDVWQEQYAIDRDTVFPNMLAIKIPGRLKGLREAWNKYQRDIATKRVVNAYASLRMEEALAWFDGVPAGTNHAGLEEIMRRVETVRSAAANLRDATDQGAG